MIWFTHQAETDLEDIADFIARDNPARALTFVRDLRVKAVGIHQSPRAFPLVHKHEQREIRRHIHGSYVILYRLGGTDVAIIRILHTTRDFQSILDDDGQ